MYGEYISKDGWIREMLDYGGVRVHGLRKTAMHQLQTRMVWRVNSSYKWI
jgi:hypothetical protein